MKLPASLAALALLAGACAALPAGPAVRAQTAPPPAASSAAPASATVDLAAEKAVYEGLCTGCHETGLIEAQGRTPAEWDEVAHSMLDRGLVASPAEIAQIVDYLSKTFPAAK